MQKPTALNTYRFSIFILIFFLVSCRASFGEKYTLGNLEIYYTEDIPTEFVEGLGKFYSERELILDHPHSIRITSTSIDAENPGFILQMVKSNDAPQMTEDEKHTLIWLQEDIQKEVFEGHPLSIEICDENFNPIP